MKDLKKFIWAAILLGALSFISIIFSHLALTDIYHGETNVVLEWNILRISALVMLAFIGIALFTLIRVLKSAA